MIICRKKKNFHGHYVNKLSLFHKKDNNIFVVLEIDYMNLLIIRTNTFFFFWVKNNHTCLYEIYQNDNLLCLKKKNLCDYF